MKKKGLIIGVGVVVACVLAFLVVRGNRTGESVEILTNVKFGTFRVEIETTGELEAKNSVQIMGPTGLREFRINQLTIQDIVPEGTIVDRGDWIATIDKAEFQGRIKDKEIDLDKAQAQFTQTQLDTTLQMRQARDALINLRYDVEERRIILEQSKFEPPATIKQAEIDLDKAQRAYDQAVENNKIKRRQNIEQMREVAADLRDEQNEYDGLMNLDTKFRILAPEPGMVIYRKGWDNKPIKAGSTVSTWDATVATLPDLTKMLSKTYVNEVDVRKVKAGQRVEIGLDAYPDKRLAGIVRHVANVGEQRPNNDAKVFLVDIEINGTDPSLRPAMTTSNKIIASIVDSALYVPLECLHSEYDSITYVFKKEGLNTVKQEVQVGLTNANEAIILSGLEEGERLYLSVPDGFEGENIQLLHEMDGKRRPAEPEAGEQTSASMPGIGPDERAVNRAEGRAQGAGGARDGQWRRNREGNAGAGEPRASTDSTKIKQVVTNQ